MRTASRRPRSRPERPTSSSTPGDDNRIVVVAGANGTIDRAYVRRHYDAVASADCLLLQNEIPAAPVEPLLADLAGAPDPPTVVLDPAPADGVQALLGQAAVGYCTPNERECEAIRGRLDRFDGVLVRKRGADDVVVEDGERYTVTPPTVDPVDTTGAGDVLNGFMAARLAAGASPREAIEVGTVAAALSTREHGARAGIPAIADVRSSRASPGRSGGG